MIRRRLVTAIAVLRPSRAMPAVAEAHPLGNFTVNRYSLVQLDRGSVHVTFVLDEAEIPTFQDLGGQPTADRARAWACAHVPAFASKLAPDGERQRGAARARHGRRHGDAAHGAGRPALHACDVPLSARISGRAASRQRSRTTRSETGSAGRRSSCGPRPGRSSPSRRPRRTTCRTCCGITPRACSRRRSTSRTATFGYRYGTGTSVSVGAPGGTGGESVAVSGGAFTDLVTHRDLGPGFILLAIGIAMFWGAVHALSPGHGKSIVAAYLVGSRGTARHAAFLGLTVTITHTASIFVLGIVTLYLSHYILPETLYPWLSVISGLVVVGMGAIDSAFAGCAGCGRRRTASHHDQAMITTMIRHDHAPTIITRRAGRPYPHPPGGDGSAITARSMLALGISGGILPAVRACRHARRDRRPPGRVRAGARRGIQPWAGGDPDGRRGAGGLRAAVRRPRAVEREDRPGGAHLQRRGDHDPRRRPYGAGARDVPRAASRSQAEPAR